MFLSVIFRLSSEGVLVLSTVDGRTLPKHPLKTFKTELKTNLFTACLVNFDYQILTNVGYCLVCYDLRAINKTYYYITFVYMDRISIFG